MLVSGVHRRAAAQQKEIQNVAYPHFGWSRNDRLVRTS